MLRRLAAGLAGITGLAVPVLVLALAPPTAATLSGCQPHNCDGDFQTYPNADGGGHWIDDDTWESTSLADEWLYFPGLREWLLGTTDDAGHTMTGREIVSMEAYVSTDHKPSLDSQSKWTLASGNLAEFRDRDGDFVILRNDTCGEYYVRVVLRAAPRTDAGGGAGDADSDASAATDAPDGG